MGERPFRHGVKKTTLQQSIIEEYKRRFLIKQKEQQQQQQGDLVRPSSSSSNNLIRPTPRRYINGSVFGDDATSSVKNNDQADMIALFMVVVFVILLNLPMVKVHQ